MKTNGANDDAQRDVLTDGRSSNKVEHSGDSFNKARALEEIRMAELKLKEWSSIYEGLTRKKESTLPRISELSAAQISPSEDPVRLAFLSLQQDDVAIPGQLGINNGAPLL